MMTRCILLVPNMRPRGGRRGHFRTRHVTLVR
jgi:hypothetical protein